MIEIEDQFRFDIIDFGDEIEEAYIFRLKEEKERRQREIEEEVVRVKKEIEEKGVCEYCGSNVMPRWVDRGDCYGADGTYQCYECFENNLQCWADVMIPSYSLKQMFGYLTENEWEELWEQEQKMKNI